MTTGPSHADVLRTNPVLRSMAAAGLLCPDPLGLGLLVADHCRAVDAAGAASSSLFVAGPLARGHVGELMGVPEVIVHAETVAHTISVRYSARERGIPAPVEMKAGVEAEIEHVNPRRSVRPRGSGTGREINPGRFAREQI